MGESINHLLDPALDKLTDEIVAGQALRDEAGLKAAQEPLPGPAREAFSVTPDIIVGPYRVRQARDYDLKLLRQLDNPFYKLAMTGDETGVTVTGESAWDFCWVMTHPVRDAKAFVEKNGLPAMRKAAEDEFGFLATGDLSLVVNAAARQLAASAYCMVAHQSPKQPGVNGEDEKGVARGDSPPSGAPLTA